jgi:hypothetical protein
MKMKSPPILQDSDSAAAAQAAQSRQEGSALVRDHIDNHLQHNTGRSSDYVTWIATLHPENADVTIDQRFLIPGNPWWTIYEEAKDDIPSATAVPVVDEEHDEEAPSTNNGTSANPNPTPVPPPNKPPCILLCSPVDLFAGILVTFHAILGVLICEILAFAFYLVAALFYWLAKPFGPPNACTGIFYSFLMIFYYSFAMADSICLLTSVLVTEVVACVGWLVSVCFGGIWRANHWHQYIRRICHLLRWALRSPCTNPPRHFARCCMMGNKQEDDIFDMPEPLTAETTTMVTHDKPYTITETSTRPGVYEVRQADIVVEGDYRTKY